MMYVYNAEVLRVIDGDTLLLNVDLGFRVRFEIKVRLMGVDTPERGEIGWREATDFVKTWVEKNKQCVIKTEKDKTEKYGRYLATLYPIGLLEESSSLNSELTKNNLHKSIINQ